MNQPNRIPNIRFCSKRITGTRYDFVNGVNYSQWHLTIKKPYLFLAYDWLEYEDNAVGNSPLYIGNCISQYPKANRTALYLNYTALTQPEDNGGMYYNSKNKKEFEMWMNIVENEKKVLCLNQNQAILNCFDIDELLIKPVDGGDIIKPFPWNLSGSLSKLAMFYFWIEKISL